MELIKEMGLIKIMETITVTNMQQITGRIVTNNNKTRITAQITGQQVEISKWFRIKKIKLFTKKKLKSSKIQGILLVKIYHNSKNKDLAVNNNKKGNMIQVALENLVFVKITRN